MDRFEFLHEFRLRGRADRRLTAEPEPELDVRGIDRSLSARRLKVLGAAVIPWAAVECLNDPWHACVDESLVAAHEDIANGLWRPYLTAKDQKSLLVTVGRQATAVREVLGQSMTGAQRQRLYEVSVGLHAEAGLLGLRLHELDVADGFFALACAATQDSGDGRLQALQVSTHISSLNYGGSGGNDKLTLTLVEQAATHAGNADAHTRAETLRRLAEQRALDGDEPGFQLALEQAYQEFGRVDGSERGFSARAGAFLAPHWLHAAVGMGYMAVKRNSEALREFRTAVRDPVMGPRGRAYQYADMARVWVQLDEPEQACAELAVALDLAVPIGHQIGLQRIRGVRALSRPEWADLACVRDLDERLHVTAAAA